MSEEGSVKTHIEHGIGSVTFFHPKGNSLPGVLLASLAEEIAALGENDDCRVIILRSAGERTFCAGASFAELTAVSTAEQGTDFFMGFARVILAMRRAPKFVVARVQGKAVGGGVGLISASDYALAVDGASIKLSELALGIGPFVVGPAVERKLGTAAFAAAAIDADWRDAAWAKAHGLYVDVFEHIRSLDEGVREFTKKLSSFSPRAMAELKKATWCGTDDWERLLPERAAMSGMLVTSEEAQQAITKAKG